MWIIDTETRSECDIKKQGGVNYALHDSTYILCAIGRCVETKEQFVYVGEPTYRAVPRSIRGNDVVLLERYGPLGRSWRPDVPRLSLEGLRDLAKTATFVAHNGDGFDRPLLERFGVHAKEWIDSSYLVAHRGLPLSLDGAAVAAFGIGKPKEAKSLLKLTYPQKGHFIPLNEQNFSLLLEYCYRDVLLLAALWVSERLEPLWKQHQAVMKAHHVVNRRGIAVDLDLADRLLTVDKSVLSRLRRHLKAHGCPPLTFLSKRDKMIKWLKEYGVETDGLTKDHVKALLKGDLPHVVQETLKARLGVTTAHTSKLKNLRGLSRGGRIGDCLRYHGAHTGRWAGRGYQPHNLSQGKEAPLSEGDADLWSMSLGEAWDGYLRSAETWLNMIKGAVRSCFLAPVGHVLVVGDWSAIEARGLAWLAGEEWLLDLFRAGGDPYLHMASKIFGEPVTDKEGSRRAVGKTTVLACGYSMSDRYGTFSKRLEADDINIGRFDLTATGIVEQWRNAHPAIAGKVVRHTDDGTPIRAGGLWQRLEAAAKRAVRGTPTAEGRCLWEKRGNHLHCVLPSGREIVYRNVHLEDRRLSYRHPMYKQIETYGGKLTENITQAVCADVLRDALVRWQDTCVLHVHDELVLEVPTEDGEVTKAALTKDMETTPKWAEGFPLKAKVKIQRRYSK